MKAHIAALAALLAASAFPAKPAVTRVLVPDHAGHVDMNADE